MVSMRFLFGPIRLCKAPTDAAHLRSHPESFSVLFVVFSKTVPLLKYK